MIQDFAMALKKRIAQTRAEKADLLIRGSYKTLDDYKHDCGVIRGLDLAVDELTALLQYVENHDGD